MAKVPNGKEKLPKISTGWVGPPILQTDRRQTDGTAIAYSERKRERLTKIAGLDIDGLDNGGPEDDRRI